jgi:hypothetical protein
MRNCRLRWWRLVGGNKYLPDAIPSTALQLVHVSLLPSRRSNQLNGNRNDAEIQSAFQIVDAMTRFQHANILGVKRGMSVRYHLLI